ncbi:unnamed protein product [Discula destructiva]
MFSQTALSLSLSLVAFLGVTLVAAADCSSLTCTTSGGHIIVTRESYAPTGTSAMNIIALGVKDQCAGSDIVEVPYPATIDDYNSSEQQGVGNLTELVLEYQECCPESKLVLLGYSQGAQVTMDFLCGTTETGFPTTEAYAANATDNIASIVLYGDPSFVKDLPWDQGTANNTSFFPRQDNAACDPVADQLVSYCDYDDYYCDAGTSVQVHASYVERYHTESIDYILSTLDC